MADTSRTIMAGGAARGQSFKSQEAGVPIAAIVTIALLGALGAYYFHSLAKKHNQKQIKRLKAELDELKDLQNQDPQHYAENEKRIFEKFVEIIPSMNFGTDDETRTLIGLQGEVSAGKSTIVNALHNNKQLAATGRSRTTLKPTLLKDTILHEDGSTKIHIYDLPGNDSKFDYMDHETLCLIRRLSLVVIAYENTIDYTVQVVKIALALGRKVMLVRTKLDNGEKDDDWKKDLEEDRKEVEELWPEEQIKVFGISARNVLEGKEETYEWNEFVSEIKNVPIKEETRWNLEALVKNVWKHFGYPILFLFGNRERSRSTAPAAK